MTLRECASWLFEVHVKEHEVTSSEAEAIVKRLAVSSSSSFSIAQAEIMRKDSGGRLPLHRVAFRARGRYARDVFTAVFNAYPSIRRGQRRRESSGGFRSTLWRGIWAMLISALRPFSCC